MRAVLQRVKQASVLVDGRTVGAIQAGLLILLGVGLEDGPAQAEALAAKAARLRVFEDDQGLFNLDVLQSGGQALVVSQFTLLADTAKGRRPSFTGAARPEQAEPLYRRFIEALKNQGLEVAEGVFGARMEVHLVNDGPVTIILETRD